MNYKMYSVSKSGQEGSSWELLAKSPEHAILTIRKFYPIKDDEELVACELTLTGDPITLLHTLNYGDKFVTILHTSSGKPAIRGHEFLRGEFDPSRNKYRCHSTHDSICYFDPYTKIIKL